MAGSKRSQKKQNYLKVIFQKAQTAQILSVLFIILGAFLIFVASASYLNLDFRHPFLENEPQKIVLSRPRTLYIPRFSRILPVSEGEVVNNRWTISQTGVSFLKESSIPGSTGNSVIYGHNLKNILGDLPYLVRGDKIVVVLNSGQFVKYEVFEGREISPNQVEILNQTEDSRLTIYTCSGFLDTARYVVFARKVNT